ncbi:MAG: xanthine dehydrogenase family protein [Deltaproteobacteria bacterium]|nr:xanthine dehydrogenase family protein [Deltaproteobacteria bacterium]
MSASGLGTYVTRKDGPEKVDGSAAYVDDLSFSGMLHAAVAMSEHPHAYLDDVNIEAARQAPGVHAVLTAKDIPGENLIAVASADQPLLATEKVRWLGDRLAIIAADTPFQARAAAKLVQGTYRPLKGVFDMEEALKKGAPVLHEKHPTKNLAAKGCVYKGDVKKGEKEADVVVEGFFDIGMQEHAYLETQGSLAVPQRDGSVLLYGSMQCPFYVQDALCKVLDMPMNKVRVVQTVTGGAFGGKEDYPSEPAACAALLAQNTGRPVKFIMNREEDMAFSSKREAQRIHHRIGAKNDGTIVFVDIDLFLDAGAYLGLASVVADRGNASSIGPYRVPHVRVDTHTVYTSNAFSGAFRGFGHPQVAVATESQIDELAHKLDMCPVELRRINLLQAGDIAPTGEKLSAPVEARDTLEQALKRLDYDGVKKRIDDHNAKNERTRLGVGISSISYGSCLHAGGQFLEGAGSLVQVHRDGSVSVSVGNTEMGQGMVTVMAQLAADTLGICYEQVRVKATDTDLVPDSGPTVASRTTTMSGQAVVDGCRQLKEELEPTARHLLGLRHNARVVFEGGKFWGEMTPRKKKKFEELIAAAYVEKRQLMKSGWYAPPRKVWDVKSGQGQPYSAYAYATQIAVVEVDTFTGRTRVQKVVACHDVGKAIFHEGAAGQVEGGVVQGMGYALMECFAQSEGKIRNNNFTDYIIPSALDAPEIDVVLIESEGVGDGQAAGPLGAKGLGEPSLIPIAGAICNAIRYATGERVTKMPFMPERVLEAIEKAGSAGNPLASFPTE